MRQSSQERALARCMEKNPAARSFHVPLYGAKQALATIIRVFLGIAVGLIIWEACSLIFNANGSTLGFPDPLSAFQRLGEYLLNPPLQCAPQTWSAQSLELGFLL